MRPAIEGFYRALFARDTERIGQMVDEHFAPDAVLHRPESLPGGGRTEGAGRIKRFMVGAATMQGGPLDVSEMKIARVIEGGGDEVAVQGLLFEVNLLEVIFDGAAGHGMVCRHFHCTL